MIRPVLLVAALLSPLAHGTEPIHYTAGIAAMDEGDDRLRPALSVGGHRGSDWLRGYYMGRRFGPVVQRSVILSAGRAFDVYPMVDFLKLQALLGLSAMNEYTGLEFDDGIGDEGENSTNFGVVLGVRCPFYEADGFSSAFVWESHLFAAGEAGILLSTGRKQAFALIGGIRL